ncbi:MAG: hypothetical protein PHQ28_10460 [Mycobacterium sp.]|nr:hypothetical protein [Mycobacterium sp.]
MSYLDVAKDQVLGLVDRVVEVLPRPSAAQTVTIACPLERIEQFWRDPTQLSAVLSDIAEIDSDGQDRYHWRVLSEPGVAWDCELIEQPGGLRFVGVRDSNELSVSYRPAPRDLGTEVTLRLSTPAPGMLSGAAAYKVLYRLRALMQTGEVPTLLSNPSARRSAR